MDRLVPLEPNALQSAGWPACSAGRIGFSELGIGGSCSFLPPRMSSWNHLRSKKCERSWPILLFNKQPIRGNASWVSGKQDPWKEWGKGTVPFVAPLTVPIPNKARFGEEKQKSRFHYQCVFFKGFPFLIKRTKGNQPFRGSISLRQTRSPMDSIGRIGITLPCTLRPRCSGW